MTFLRNVSISKSNSPLKMFLDILLELFGPRLYILGWVTEAFSIGISLILWRFSKICHPYKVFAINTSDLQPISLMTSPWCKGSAVACQPDGSEFKSSQGQFFFNFL